MWRSDTRPTVMFSFSGFGISHHLEPTGIVEPRNQIKRFIYCCLCKRYRENFEDAIDADETTVELRYTFGMNYRKDSGLILRAAGGKIGQTCQKSLKIHLNVKKFIKIYQIVKSGHEEPS